MNLKSSENHQQFLFQFDIGSCGLMNPGSSATVHIDYRYLREGIRKKIRNYLGIFPNIGGGSPHSQNFCYPNHSPKNPLKTP